MMTEDPTIAVGSGSSVPHVRKSTRTSSSSATSHPNDMDNSHRSGTGTNNNSNSSNNMNSTSTSDHHHLHHPSLTVAAGNSEHGSISSGGLNNNTTTSSNINAPSMTNTVSSSSSSLLYSQQQQQQRALSSSLNHHHHHNLSTSTSTMYHMNLHRLYDIRQMDIQSALDQMKTLISTRPQLIYKTAYYRKQTKNHWYRDDPAFHCIQIIFLLLSCIAYSIAFKVSILQAISFILTSIIWNYLLLGIIIATALREFTNRHLLSHHHHPTTSTISTTNTSTSSTSLHIQRQQVEWLYAFDIHCNAFFPLFIVLYVVQFFSMPITLGEGLIPLIIANTLYSIAFSWYWYITHLGYRALPFLSHTEIFLFPITIIVLFFIIMMIGYPFGFGYNMTRFMARFYFI